MFPSMARRAFLRQSSVGFGLLGLRSLIAETVSKTPHFAPRAKRIIFLFMHGGPSSIDTFDPKPRLIQDHGNPVPFKRGLTFGEDNVRGLMKSPWEFKQYGQSAIPVSELFPNVATCVDDLCVIRSMVGDGVDHGAALLQLHTGSRSGGHGVVAAADWEPRIESARLHYDQADVGTRRPE
ncbi:MAG: DUF1501 domain-containing protein [Bryobacteraceae bacterium]